MKSFTNFTCCQFGLSLLAIILFTSVIVSAESNTCIEVNVDIIHAMETSESNGEINQLTETAIETLAVCGDEACKNQGVQSGNLNGNGTFGSSSGGKKYKTLRYEKKASIDTLNGAIKRISYQDCKDAVANACADFEDMCGPESDKPCKRDTSPSGTHMTKVILNNPATKSANAHSSKVKCSGYCGC